MRRSYWFTVVAIPLLLGAADVAYWRIASDRLRMGYEAWLASNRGRGWDVGSGPVAIGGWPGSAAITLPNLKFHHSGPTIPGDVDVASAGVTLAVSLLNPTNLRLSLAGPMHIRAGGLPDVIVTSDEASMSIPLRQNGTLSIVLYGRGVRLDAATGGWHATVGLLNGRVELATVASSDRSQPIATYTLSSEAIALPAGVKWPLGPNISSLAIDGRVTGPLPETSDVTAWAEAWRDGGGSLEITHLAMGWGPLGITSAATLALDDQLQPMGSGNGRIFGYAETLDRLATAGMLTKSAATAAKAVLSLMAGTGDPDQPSSVDVPLTLQYRTLSMRQVPLVRLPELDWPGH